MTAEQELKNFSNKCDDSIFTRNMWIVIPYSIIFGITIEKPLRQFL